MEKRHLWHLYIAKTLKDCFANTWLDWMLFFSSSQPPSLILSFPPKLNSHLLITSLKTQTIDNLLHTLFSSNFSFVLFVFSLLAFSVSRHPCPIWPKLTQSTTPFPLTNLLCPPPSFVLILHHLLHLLLLVPSPYSLILSLSSTTSSPVSPAKWASFREQDVARKDTF